MKYFLNQHGDDAKLWFICDTRNAPVTNLYISRGTSF